MTANEYSTEIIEMCPQCGTHASPRGHFCTGCGTALNSVQPQQEYCEPPPDRHVEANNHHIAARGFGQLFGLHPATAFLTLIVDTMLFGGAVVSLGTSLPFSLVAGCVLGYITYNAQIKWYGDDKDSAKIKALIVAFLTAIPSPLPYLLFIPSGLVGLAHNRRKAGN